ncbi:MAG: dihydroorotase [Pseudomonadales bacterium]|nr:dihydroorotase [Pseudomonadales bacterium]
MQKLTITRPDDWHIHLRDGAQLALTVKDCSRYFGRAIVMPNLLPPVTSCEAAIAYKERIKAEIDTNSAFEPLMTLYLTDNTAPEEIIKAQQAGIVACKLYPAGATTNSDAGVTHINNIYPVLEAMQKAGIPLLLHGEVTDNAIDIFDRERIFLDTVLSQLCRDFPSLKIVLEHITTADAVNFVAQAGNNVAATITAHHLLFNRNHLLAGGIRPHYYCLPILKRQDHQQALIKAATSGNARFFLGTDSAPHSIDKKQAACGCAGCYTAHAAIEMYAEVFESMNALDKLEGFASFFGPDFYGLPRNSDTITLEKSPWLIPDELDFGALNGLTQSLRPLLAGETLNWRVCA